MSPGSKPKRRLNWLVLDLQASPPVLRCRHCDATGEVELAPDAVSIPLARLSDAMVQFTVAHEHREPQVAVG